MSLSRIQLFATPWAITCQALCPWDPPGKNTEVGSPGDLPNPGIEPVSLASPALAINGDASQIVEEQLENKD